MAAIIILVSAIDRHAAPAGQYRIQGQAEVEGAPDKSAVSWEIFAKYTDGIAAVNTACVAAAVAAAVAAGFVVGPLDTKTLFGSAVIG